MVKRFLITTALEETWKDDEPVLFLGEWCRLYHRQKRWSKMDAEVLPYHWDDRKKLYADYQYLRELHERLLQDLTVQLNQIHGVSYSLRYWRILIGPWLGYFTQMLFDRWTSIQQAIAGYDLSETIILADVENNLIPNDMAEFVHFFVEDKWNHHIYALILRQFTQVSCVQKARVKQELRAPVISFKAQLKQKLRHWLSVCTSIFTRDTDIFFLATYLPRLAEIKLSLRLKQMPQFWPSVFRLQIKPDLSWRKWIVDGENFSEFELCIRSLIPQQMPKAYLEGYSQFVRQLDDLPWPKKPKLIWTSNAHGSNDVFKVWAAIKVEQGSELIIGQHGGHYGIGLWSFVEEHDVAISDRYLSWGWTESGMSKIKAIGQLKSKKPLGFNHARQAHLLLVTSVIPRQSYWMYSATVSRQWLDYFNDQCMFIRNLPRSIQNALIVRLYAQDYGWGQIVRWQDQFPDVSFDRGYSDINHLIGKSRLYISTYNATTFLESFTMNVPTVIYWNPKHWELRDSAIPYFEELKRVGIFHETPESAAKHVAKIWENVDVWWSSVAVQNVVGSFKRNYCHLPNDLLSRLENILQEAEIDNFVEL